MANLFGARKPKKQSPVGRQIWDSCPLGTSYLCSLLAWRDGVCMRPVQSSLEEECMPPWLSDRVKLIFSDCSSNHTTLFRKKKHWSTKRKRQKKSTDDRWLDANAEFLKSIVALLTGHRESAGADATETRGNKDPWRGPKGKRSGCLSIPHCRRSLCWLRVPESALSAQPVRRLCHYTCVLPY